MERLPVPAPVPLPLPLATTLVPVTVPTAQVGVRQEHLTIASVPDYGYLGCFEDYQSEDRVLQGASITVDDLNPADCCAWCSDQNPDYTLCGLEFASECYCGSTLLNDLSTTDGCKYACNGGGDSRCGGYWAMDLYSSTVAPTAQDVPGYTNLGCFTDYSDDRRVLRATQSSFDELNPQTCCNWCTEIDPNYRHCGVEFGGQCRCDSTVGFTDSAYSSECDMPCFGQPSYKCGATWRINLYEAAAATTGTGTETGGEAQATTTTTGDDAEDEDEGSEGLSTEVIVGIVFGVVTTVGVIVAIWQCCCR